MVLGSTCFAKRFGDSNSLGLPAYSAGIGGTLSDADRETLISNTAALIEAFKSRHELAMAQAEAKLQALKARMAVPKPARHPMFVAAPLSPRPAPPAHPWPWQHHRNSSLGAVRSPSGHLWVRVQHQDGSQKLAPYPVFEGWDTALPGSLGTPDMGLQAYGLADVVQAMQRLRQMGFSAPEISRWPDVLKLVPRRAAGAV